MSSRCIAGTVTRIVRGRATQLECRPGRGFRVSAEVMSIEFVVSPFMTLPPLG